MFKNSIAQFLEMASGSAYL